MSNACVQGVVYEVIKIIAGITSFIPNEHLAVVVYWAVIVFLSMGMFGIGGLGLFIAGLFILND